MSSQWNSSRHNWIGYLTLAFLVLGIGAWAFFTRINGAIIAGGIVEVETNRQVVQHQIGGVVGEVFVKDGEVVKAGQLLLRLDDTFDRAELAIVESQLYTLLGTTARLTAEQDDSESLTFDPELLERAAKDPEIKAIVDGQERLFRARRETADKQVSQLQERKQQVLEQITGLEQRTEALGDQLAIVEKELLGQNKLLKDKLTQASRVMALERDAAEIRGDISGAKANVAENRGKIAEIEIAILNIRVEMREESITTLRDIEGKIAELRQKRATALETLSRMEVRAPVGGAVFGLQVHARRSVVRAAEPMLYIIPQDVGLVITTQISPAQIDQVHVGQDAILRFAAFDHRTTPDLNGHVIEVSADVFTDEKTGASYYKAQVEPMPGETTKLGQRQVLPGMPVEAFIQTYERSPLEYLIKPLSDYFVKAFRER
ncbi:HlyD family type I secretion periplasmic adaptor subunit [Rhizobiaceae bacterium n13]|uniref:Membrane fusion protein (MFP) family protein n=1 Tax=Ferirhizobium litorale TaxID=2927786 RepID=A0AAE3QE54_9HYPH|nr:HlyD family type I secretion periplasmic adaptor subunit [Fererhizobium litorale]MDI7861381.1 HlyD family type I secretion periplasmic adaptor subunit [Fererhizobium litorale]MDI7921528.1 HlyD family type I secretion periplasmic adaptor subunit [Fererhizobium litorale]